jgi:alpha-tubulin suppressor-like RCC1 family protein
MAHCCRHIILVVCFSFVMQLLVSCGGGGGGSSPSNNNTNSSVSNVISFAATAGDTSVSLSWENPPSNFAGVMLRRGVTCPATPTSGTLVADTMGTSTLDSGLTNGTTYCYAAFVHDSSNNFSSGVTAYAMPVASTVASVASYVAVSAGGIHTLAIKSDRTLWTWGYNEEGELGDGCTFGLNCYNRNSPTQVGSDNTWGAVSGGTTHSAAIKQNGTLWSWGDNSSGQIGTGCSDSTCFYISTPTQVTTDTNWASTSAGGFFTVAIKTDGTLWAWGNNYAGQLGDGCSPMSTCIESAIPKKIGTNTDWASVAAGGNHVIALKTNGTLWAWGINDYGQLGNAAQSPTAYSSVPVQIGTDTDWKSITAGDMHSLAIKTNGTLWAWGDNDWGQLGITCLTSCSSVSAPIQVGTDANWKDVDGGFNLTIAVKTDGTVWAWGNFSSSTGTSSSVPVQVGTGTSWSKVSAGGGGGTSGIGGGHFMALESMNPSGYKLMGWGTNMYGQLGIGTASPVWNPIQVY